MLPREKENTAVEGEASARVETSYFNIACSPCALLSGSEKTENPCGAHAFESEKSELIEMLLALTTPFLIMTVLAVLFGLIVVVTGILLLRAVLKYFRHKDDPENRSNPPEKPL